MHERNNMAQGAIKQKSAKPVAPRRPSGKTAKRGNGVIKPKKPALLARQKLVKKHTAGLSGLTERTLAERAGHLELLEGGKRGKKAEAQGKGKGKEVVGKKK